MTTEYDYIKILSKKEISAFINSLQNKAKDLSEISQKILDSNRLTLINEYLEYERRCLEEYKKSLDNFNREFKLWKNKICQCGNPLRYIENYNFWGCPKYYDKKINHSKFSDNQELIFKQRFKGIKVRLSHNWSTDILKNCCLHGKIKAKELLAYYQSEGFEDLREKYGYRNSMESISSFVFANLNSKSEELEIYNFLKKYFKKASYQLYIKFKKKNEPEKIRIIDVIVSDNEFIYLIEIKRHNIYISEEQLIEYHDLIKNIMNSKGDNRTLRSLFIVNEYYESEYNFNNCVDFNELRNLKTKLEITKIFDEYTFK